MEEQQVGLSVPPSPSEALRGEDRYIFSDFHLGEGRMIEEEVRPSLFARLTGRAPKVSVFRTIKNPLEDFYHDEVVKDEKGEVVKDKNGVPVTRVIDHDAVFEACLRKIVRERRPDRRITVELNGDIFDFLAVRWKGRVDRNPPKERCAIAKLRAIKRGHQRFFAALIEFLCQPDVGAEVTMGNHDHALDHPGVQSELIGWLSGGDPAIAAKILIIDRTHGYKRLYRKVLKLHGNNCEAHNVIEADNSIVTHRLGVPLKEPELNDPVGNHMVVRTANRLKCWNPMVGRVIDESLIWWHSAQFDWRWSVLAGCMLVWTLMSNMLTKFWDVRTKAGPLMVLRVALASARSESAIDVMRKYEDRMLAETPARVIVTGHIHVPYRVTVDGSTRVNTGTWAQQLRLVEAHIGERRWKRCRWLEPTVRRLQRLDAKQRTTRLLRAVALTLALIVFVTSSFLVNGLHLFSYDLRDFWRPAQIMFFFWLVAFGFRSIAVKPDVVDGTEFPFVRIRHEPDDPEEKDMRVDLMVYDPAEDAFRDMV